MQRNFVEALFGRSTSITAFQQFSNQVGGEPRVEIYRNNTFTNLRHAMQSAYPVIGKLVGEGFFNYAATEYTYRYPSCSGDLHTYGAAFAEFLQRFSPAEALPYLADVARLEWACHTAFFAADHAPLDLLRLAAIPEERYSTLNFKLHPACRLVESAYPIDEIWHANQESADISQSIDLDRGGAQILVRRPLHHAEVISLTDSEWRFLNSLASGDTLGTACEYAQQTNDDFDLLRILLRHVNEMTLVDVIMQ